MATRKSRSDSSSQPTRAKQQQSEPDEESEEQRKNEPATLNFDAEVLNRARNAITYITSYVEDPPYFSLGDMASDAMKPVLDELERDYNNGQPFPQVMRMPRGRPARKKRD